MLPCVCSVIDHRCGTKVAHEAIAESVTDVLIHSFTLHHFLARQLVDYPHGNGLEVIFGGGREKLMSKNDTDPEYPNETGERLDGRNLIKEWIDKYPNSQYVWNKTGFDDIKPEMVDRVMG